MELVMHAMAISAETVPAELEAMLLTMMSLHIERWVVDLIWHCQQRDLWTVCVCWQIS
jgi:hypothetical protein